MTREEELLNRLRKVFSEEVEEHLRTMMLGLIELEQTGLDQQPTILETTFRSAHSLKGAARSIDERQIEAICKGMEDIFGALREEKITATKPVFDALHGSLRFLRRLTDELDSGPGETVNIESILNLLSALLDPSAQAASQPAIDQFRLSGRADPPDQSSETDTEVAVEPLLNQGKSSTIRVDAQRVDDLLKLSEELLLVKQSAVLRTARLMDLASEIEAWSKHFSAVNPRKNQLDQMLSELANDEQRSYPVEHLSDFLISTRKISERLDMMVREQLASSQEEDRSIATRLDLLYDGLTRAAMRPFSDIVYGLPLLVRDISQEQGKQVNLVVTGDEIEIHKQVLERLKDPLTHLVRNCLDHGIEPIEERIRSGKPESAQLRLEIDARSSSQVTVVVSDDGRGVDIEKLRRKLNATSTLDDDEVNQLTDDEILDYIFQSGVSTSDMVTDLSGRGLGLAIVRDGIEDMGGGVTVSTQSGAGTTFELTFPLTLSRQRGLIVRAGESLLVIPIHYVLQAVRFEIGDVRRVDGHDTIRFGSETLPIAAMATILDLEPGDLASAESVLRSAIVVAVKSQKFALEISEICGESEVLIKTLGPQKMHIKNFTGATVLADGKLAPVINVPELISTATSMGRASIRSSQARTESDSKLSILIAEDSMTTRALLRNIVEAAGYGVVTAVDGYDAIEKLEKGNFNLLISDVDMPRMNGFSLTSRVRSDKKLSELPVILLTSLSSTKDREHGVSVGADAYLVKGDFEQTNLLATIERYVGRAGVTA